MSHWTAWLRFKSQHLTPNADIADALADEAGQVECLAAFLSDDTIDALAAMGSARQVEVRQ